MDSRFSGHFFDTVHRILPTSWRNRNVARGLIGVGAMMGIASLTWGVDQDVKAVNIGLRGILPNKPPSVLQEEEFARLDGKWAEWSKDTSAAVAQFYSTLDSTDVASQRASIKALKTKVEVMRLAILDPDYASLHGPLTDLYTNLAQRTELAEASIDTLEQAASQVVPSMPAATQQLLTAVDRLDAELTAIPNGIPWFNYFKADVVRGAIKSGAANHAVISAATESQMRLEERSTMPEGVQKDFAQKSFFNIYESAVKAYHTAVAQQSTGNLTEELRKQLQLLSAGSDSFAETRSKVDAAQVRAAFSTIRLIAPDGGQKISMVLRSHLLNYNLRIVASEDFLNRLMSDSRVESGPVSDYILGASVSGQQSTTTSATVDLLPSQATLKFNLALSGHITSTTQGVTPQATVFTSGSHDFMATKEVQFNGTRFVTAPAEIRVTPHNTTTGISTKFGNVPIFRRVAQGMAAQQVAEKTPEAEAITASRIREQVLPKFDGEVDRAFVNAGAKLDSGLLGGLRSTGLSPDAISYSSTDTAISVNSRLLGADELSGNIPSPNMFSTVGATLLMHESVINNSIDRMDLAGQTLAEPQLREKLQSFLSQALGRPVTLNGPTKAATESGETTEDSGPKAIIFSAVDPIRIRIRNGEMELVIQAGFKQDDGKDDIPTREIIVPLTFDVVGEQIAIKRGTVTVVAASGEGGGLAINGVVRKKIQSILPDRSVTNQVDLKGTNKTVKTNVSRISLTDGWVSISVN